MCDKKPSFVWLVETGKSSSWYVAATSMLEALRIAEENGLEPTTITKLHVLLN